MTYAYITYNIVSFILRTAAYNASHASHITNLVFLSGKTVIINNFQQVHDQHSKLDRVIIGATNATLPIFLLTALISRISYQSNPTIQVPSHNPTIQAFISK